MRVRKYDFLQKKSGKGVNSIKMGFTIGKKDTQCNIICN